MVHIERRCIACGPIEYSNERFFCYRKHEYCASCQKTVLELKGCKACVEEDNNHTLDFTVSCIYKNRGCNHIMINEDNFHHYKECKYRILRCESRSFGIEECKWSGGILEVDEHFKQDHPDFYETLWNNVECTIPFKIDEAQRDIQLIKLEGQIFFYKHFLDIVAEKFYVTVQMIGTESQANRYFYHYKIMYENSVINMIGMCHSDTQPETDLCEDGTCVMIPMKHLEKYISNGMLKFKIDIVKIS